MIKDKAIYSSIVTNLTYKTNKSVVEFFPNAPIKY